MPTKNSLFENRPVGDPRNRRDNPVHSREMVSEGEHAPARGRRNPLVVLLGQGFSFLFLLAKILLLSAFVFLVTATASYLIVRHQIRGKELTVPNLAGFNVQEAAKSLSNSAPDLSLKLDGMEYSDMVEEGEIISQTPLAGTRVKAGSVVRIRMSKGNSRVSCPNVQGMNYQEAGIALRRVGLKEGNISLDFDLQVKKNCVIAQEPLPGAELDRQTPVNLLVSKGAQTPAIRMPDLASRTVQEARDILRNLELEMPQVLETPLPGTDNGLIVSQMPQSGSVVTGDSSITVTVVNNLGVAEPATPSAEDGSSPAATPAPVEEENHSEEETPESP